MLDLLEDDSVRDTIERLRYEMEGVVITPFGLELYFMDVAGLFDIGYDVSQVLRLCPYSGSNYRLSSGSRGYVQGIVQSLKETSEASGFEPRSLIRVTRAERKKELLHKSFALEGALELEQGEVFRVDEKWMMASRFPFYEFQNVFGPFDPRIEKRLRSIFDETCKGNFDLTVLRDGFIQFTEYMFNRGWFLNPQNSRLSFESSARKLVYAIFKDIAPPYIYKQSRDKKSILKQRACGSWILNCCTLVKAFGGNRYESSFLVKRIKLACSSDFKDQVIHAKFNKNPRKFDPKFVEKKLDVVVVDNRRSKRIVVKTAPRKESYKKKNFVEDNDFFGQMRVACIDKNLSDSLMYRRLIAIRHKMKDEIDWLHSFRERSHDDRLRSFNDIKRFVDSNMKLAAIDAEIGCLVCAVVVSVDKVVEEGVIEPQMMGRRVIPDEELTLAQKLDPAFMVGRAADKFKQEIKDEVVEMVPTITKTIVSDLYGMFKDYLLDVVKNIPQTLSSMLDSVVDMMNSDVIRKVVDFLKECYDCLKEKAAKIWSSITGDNENKNNIMPHILTWLLVGFLICIIMYVYKLASDLMRIAFMKLCLEVLGPKYAYSASWGFDNLITALAFESAFGDADCCDDEEVELRGESFGFGVSALVGVVSLVLALLDPKSLGLANTAMNLLTKVGPYADDVKGKLTDLIDELYLSQTGDHLFATKADVANYVDFIKEVQLFIAEPNLREDVLRNPVVTKKLESLVERGGSIKVMLKESSSPLLGSFSRAFLFLRELHNEALANAKMYKERIESVLVWCYGDPGEGKTRFLEMLPEDVYTDIRAARPEGEMPEWCAGQRFTRVKGSDYWDTYTGNWCTALPEILTAHSAEECRTELHEILGMCEDNVMALNVAFQDKGKVFFRSELVTVSTNQDFTEPSMERECGLRNPTAVIRRRAFPFRVTRRESLDSTYSNIDKSWNFTVELPPENRQKEFFLGLSRFLNLSPPSDVYLGGKNHLRFLKAKKWNFSYSEIKRAVGLEILWRKEKPKDANEYRKFRKPVDLKSEMESSLKTIFRSKLDIRDEEQEFKDAVKATLDYELGKPYFPPQYVPRMEAFFPSVIRPNLKKEDEDPIDFAAVLDRDKSWETQSLSDPDGTKREKILDDMAKEDNIQGQMFKKISDMYDEYIEKLDREEFERKKQEFVVKVNANLTEKCGELRKGEVDNDVVIAIQELLLKRDVSESVLDNCLDTCKDVNEVCVNFSASIVKIPIYYVSIYSKLDAWLTTTTFENVRSLFRGIRKFSKIPASQRMGHFQKWSKLAHFDFDLLLCDDLKVRAFSDFEQFVSHCVVETGYAPSCASVCLYLWFRKCYFITSEHHPFLDLLKVYYFRYVGENFVPAYKSNDPFYLLYTFAVLDKKSVQWKDEKISIKGTGLDVSWSKFKENFCSAIYDVHEAMAEVPSLAYVLMGTVAVAAITAALWNVFAEDRGLTEHDPEKEMLVGEMIRNREYTNQSLHKKEPYQVPKYKFNSNVKKEPFKTQKYKPNSVTKSNPFKTVRYKAHQGVPDIDSDILGEFFGLQGSDAIVQANARITACMRNILECVFVYEGQVKADSLLFCLDGFTFFQTAHFFIAHGTNFVKLDVKGIDGKVLFSVSRSDCHIESLNDFDGCKNPNKKIMFEYGSRDGYLISLNLKAAQKSLYKFLPTHRSEEANSLIKLKPVVMKDTTHIYVTQPNQVKMIVNRSTPMNSNFGDGRKLGFTHCGMVCDSAGKPGDCCLPYLDVYCLHESEWLKGLHVGSGGVHAYFCPIYKEDLMYIWNFKKQMYVARSAMDLRVEGVQDEMIEAQCYCEPIDVYLPLRAETLFSFKGTVSEFDGDVPVHKKEHICGTRFFGTSNRSNFIPSESCFVATPFQGCEGIDDPIYSITQAPAVLSSFLNEDGDVVNPLGLAKQKLSRIDKSNEVPDFLKYYAENDPEFIADGFLPDKYVIRPRFVKFNLRQVVFGIPGVIASVDLTTSEGFFLRGKNMKRKDVIDKDRIDPQTGRKGWIHPILYEEVSRLENAVAKGYQPKIVTIACLKDELRDLERVRLGKTRLFHVGDFVHMLWMRMVIGHAVEWIKANRFAASGAIGTNPHGQDWSFWFQYLNSMPGDLKFGGGDFEGFDSGVTHIFSVILGNLLNILYKYPIGSFLHRELMYACMSTVSPLCVLGRDAYWLDYMNPSGGWATGVINTLANSVVLKTTFLVLQKECRDSGCSCMDGLEMKDIVRKILYGDDNDWSVMTQYSIHWNLPNIARIIKQYFGMIYTRPDKKAIGEEGFIEFNELDFLCRRFSGQSVFCKAPLAKDSIHGMLLWVRDAGSVAANIKQLEQNIDTAAMEMYYYGRPEFDVFASKIQRYCLEYNVTNTMQSYDAYKKRHTSAYQ